MADNEIQPNGTDSEKQGGGIILPTGAAVVGGLGTGIAAAHFTGRPEAVEKDLAKANTRLDKAETAYDKKFDKLSAADKGKKATYDAALERHTQAAQAARDHAVSNLNGGERLKVEIESLKGEVSHLQTLEEGTGRAHAIMQREAQIKALDELSNDKHFQTLLKDPKNIVDRDLAHDAIKNASEDAVSNFERAHPEYIAEADHFVTKNAETLEKARLDAIHAVNPEVAAQVTKETRITKEGLRAAEKAWKPVEAEHLGRQARSVKSAQNEISQLNAVKGINAEEGSAIWKAVKRPFALMKEAPAGKGLLIAVVTGVGAGAAFHVFHKAEPEQQVDSFAAREQQRMAARAAAAQSGNVR